MSILKVVIDTNVVFEGITKQGGAAGLIIDSWLAGVVDVYVSNALAYEYADVLSRKLSKKRWQNLKPVLGRLLTIAQFVTIYYSWRPISSDPEDDHVIDCAMNASATIITKNLRDFQKAREALGLQELTPVEAILMIVKEG